MKLTLQELVLAESALHSLFNTPMSFKAATEITEAMEILDKELEKVDARRKELLQTHGVAHHEYEGKFILPDKQDVFNKELDEFLSKEDISDKAMIPLSIIEGVQISPRDRLALLKIISK